MPIPACKYTIFISYIVIHKGKKIERKSISATILIDFDCSCPHFVLFRSLQHFTPLSLGEGNGGEAPLCNPVARQTSYLCTQKHNMKKAMNKKLLRIILSAVLLLAAWLVTRNIAMPVWGQLLVFLVPYLIVGYDVLGEAWEGIREGDPFD